MLLLAALGGGRVAAQVGGEVQGYPAGIIAVARIGMPVATGGLNLLAGYHLTDRRDFGEHDQEEGGGPGLGVLWEWSPGGERAGPVVGIRVDFWFLDIDWRDGDRVGRSDVHVLQPTARVGYRWPLASGWELAVGAGLGAEFNVRTAGEAVGQGPILLAGVGLTFRP